MKRHQLRQISQTTRRLAGECRTRLAGSEWITLLRTLLIAAGSLAAVTGVIVLLSTAGHAPRPTPALPATASTTRSGPPTSSPTATAPPAPPAPRTAPPPPPPQSYAVRPGDTLSVIALRHNVAFEQLAARNGITDPNFIRAGTVLVIGTRSPGTEVISPGDTLATHARRFGLSTARLLTLNPHLRAPRAPRAGGEIRIAAVPS